MGGCYTAKQWMLGATKVTSIRVYARAQQLEELLRAYLAILRDPCGCEVTIGNPGVGPHLDRDNSKKYQISTTVRDVVRPVVDGNLDVLLHRPELTFTIWGTTDPEHPSDSVPFGECFYLMENKSVEIVTRAGNRLFDLLCLVGLE